MNCATTAACLSTPSRRSHPTPRCRPSCAASSTPCSPSRTTAPGWPPLMREHDVTALTAAELDVLGRTTNTGPTMRKGERKVRHLPRDYWTWADPGNAHSALV